MGGGLGDRWGLPRFRCSRGSSCWAAALDTVSLGSGAVLPDEEMQSHKAGPEHLESSPAGGGRAGWGGQASPTSNQGGKTQAGTRAQVPGAAEETPTAGWGLEQWPAGQSPAQELRAPGWVPSPEGVWGLPNRLGSPLGEPCTGGALWGLFVNRHEHTLPPPEAWTPP